METLAVVGREFRVSETGTSRLVVNDGVSPRGVQLPLSEFGDSVFWIFDGDVRGLAGALVGDEMAVFGRMAKDGNGEGDEGDSGLRNWVAGDSGRRKGDARGESKERGERL